MTVTIKGVNEETWKKFKVDAARHGQTMAEHFTNIVKQHCISMSWEDALSTAERLRKKAGTWKGSDEIQKWRAKRVF